jgi:hypothetical protein
VETLAWPSHSWTLAISASCEGAFVAAVARNECTHKPIHLGSDAGLKAVFPDDVVVDRAGIEQGGQDGPIAHCPPQKLPERLEPR